MLIFLMAITATVFVIMMMQVDKIHEPSNRLFRFTTMPSASHQSFIFEVWSGDYTQALKMAYKYRLAHEQEAKVGPYMRWQLIEELDTIDRSTINVIFKRDSEDILPEAEGMVRNPETISE